MNNHNNYRIIIITEKMVLFGSLIVLLLCGTLTIYEVQVRNRCLQYSETGACILVRGSMLANGQETIPLLSSENAQPSPPSSQTLAVVSLTCGEQAAIQHEFVFTDTKRQLTELSYCNDNQSSKYRLESIVKGYQIVVHDALGTTFFRYPRYAIQYPHNKVPHTMILILK